MTNEQKINAFEEMLKMETYEEEGSSGAWRILGALGLQRDYIKWSCNKVWDIDRNCVKEL